MDFFLNLNPRSFSSIVLNHFIYEWSYVKSQFLLITIGDTSVATIYQIFLLKSLMQFLIMKLLVVEVVKNR